MAQILHQKGVPQVSVLFLAPQLLPNSSGIKKKQTQICRLQFSTLLQAGFDMSSAPPAAAESVVATAPCCDEVRCCCCSCCCGQLRCCYCSLLRPSALLLLLLAATKSVVATASVAAAKSVVATAPCCDQVRSCKTKIMYLVMFYNNGLVRGDSIVVGDVGRYVRVI